MKSQQQKNFPLSVPKKGVQKRLGYARSRKHGFVLDLDGHVTLVQELPTSTLNLSVALVRHRCSLSLASVAEKHSAQHSLASCTCTPRAVLVGIPISWLQTGEKKLAKTAPAIVTEQSLAHSQKRKPERAHGMCHSSLFAAPFSKLNFVIVMNRSASCFSEETCSRQKLEQRKI